MKYLKTACSLTLALTLGAVLLSAEIIEQVLVRVNGEIFTKSDLEARQVAALRQMGQQADLTNDPSDAQLRKMLDEATPQLLVNTIDEMLLVQRGKELGYKMSEEQFQSIVLDAAGITHPTDADRDVVRLLSMLWYGVIIAHLNGRSSLEEAESDIRRSCRLLLVNLAA